MPTTYYLISDLHIGGDGGLAQCQFEDELIQFLREIAVGPQPAELVIVGDAFGFWELTDRAGVSKLDTIAAQQPALFRQFRETGKRVKITLLPGNHDYDLARDLPDGVHDGLEENVVRRELRPIIRNAGQVIVVVTG